MMSAVKPEPALRDQQLIEAVQIFRDKFSSNPDVAVFAPGRANLIGEHTDYNEGYVLPFALPYKTIIVASKTVNAECVVYSTAIDEKPAIFSADKTLSQGDPEWANYVKGVVYQYLDDLPHDGVSFNAVIVSNVPVGSGLSSSAAIEVATATMLEQLYRLPTNGKIKALRCQRAEHDFANTPCGIMDQYISAMGEEGNLLLIDCRSNDYTLVPFGQGKDIPVIVVTNSCVKHSLSGSEYPDRVRQCKEAVAVLKSRHPNVKSLRDANLQQLEDSKSSMSEVVYRRARHVIGEDKRTLSTVESLKAKDYATVGKNMTASHNSLRDDYEVSCVELDALVEIALKVPGVYGSRMTGGGFGGCTVTLVGASAVDSLIAKLQEEYDARFHHKCICYVAFPSAGAGLADLAGALDDVDHTESRSTSLVTDNFVTDYWFHGAVAAVTVAVGLAFMLSRRK